MQFVDFIFSVCDLLLKGIQMVAGLSLDIVLSRGGASQFLLEFTVHSVLMLGLYVSLLESVAQFVNTVDVFLALNF
jgi:hypothetical protein